MLDSMQSDISQIKVVLRKLRSLYYGFQGIINDLHLPLLIYAWLLYEMNEGSLLSMLENAAKENKRHIDINFQLIKIHDYQIPQQTLDGIDLLHNVNLLELDPKVALSLLDEEIARYINIYEEPRIPRWLCDFMAKLSNIDDSSIVLNPYNNNGEILTATLLNNEKVSTYGFSKSIGCAIWSMVEHIILNRDYTNIIQLNVLEPCSEDLFTPTHIISSPFFGKTQLWQEPSWLLFRTERIEELYFQYVLRRIKSGGRIVLLVPDGLLFGGGSRTSLREYILDSTDLKAIIALDKGTLSPFSSVKASILVIDVGMQKNNQIFMSVIKPFKDKDTFNCVQIPEVKEVLDEYNRWDVQHKIYSIKRSWIVQKNEIDIGNLTVNRYIPTEFAFNVEGKPPYPIRQLRDISISIENGKKYKVNNKGKYSVLTSAAVRKMKVLSDQIINSDFCYSSLPLIVQRGDILVNALGSQIGESVIVEEDIGLLYVGNNVIRIKADQKIVLPKYLEIALNSRYVQQQFQLRAGGTVIATVSTNRIQDIYIPVPTIEEQYRIIEALRQAELKLQNCQKQLESAKKEYDKIIDRLTV